MQFDHAATRARVHMHGVLAGLEVLPIVDAESAGLVVAEHGKMTMQCRGNGASTMTFSEGKVQVQEGKSSGARVNLLFWSPTHLNRTFDAVPKTPPPIPLAGLLSPASLRRFDQLTKRLSERLRVRPPCEDQEGLVGYVKLSFRVAAASLVVIAAEDPTAFDWMNGWPDGIAQFLGPDQTPLVWVECHGSLVTSGAGAAPNPADVRISFRDWSIAADAVDGTLENSTAVCLGQITIEGLVPLADKLGLVMDRIPHYLKR